VKALLTMHAWHVFGRGTVRFIVAMSLVVVLSLIRLTRRHLPAVERVLFNTDYVLDYALESMMLIKVCALSLMTYVAMKLFVMTPYDIALVQRTPRLKVFLSKLIVLMMSGVVAVSLWWLWAQSIGAMAHGTVHPTFGPEALCALSLMMGVYGALFSLGGVGFKHLLALLLVWVLFWVTEMAVDFGLPISSLSLSVRVLNALVANAHVFNADEVGTVWPWRVSVFIGFMYAFFAAVIYRRQAF